MFQGIISIFVPIKEVHAKPGLMRLTVQAPSEHLKDCKLGASIALDGCCLTVSELHQNCVTFDLMQETLNKTSFALARQGDLVNFERSLKAGDEIGGHLLSGHIDGVAQIVKIETPENNRIITFKVEPPLSRFIFTKGYIALNGVSLTVVNASTQENTFQVYFIPETLQRSTFGLKKVGDKINVEIDRQTQAIVETIERMVLAGTLTDKGNATLPGPR